MSGPSRTGARRVAIVGIDADRPGAWSFIPAGLAAGMAEWNVVPIRLDAELPPAAAALGKRFAGARQTHPRAWRYAPPAAAGRSLVVRGRAAAALGAHRPAGWVQAGSEFTVPRGAPVVSFEDATVAAAASLPGHPVSRLPAATRRVWQRRQERIYRRVRAGCVASHWAARSLTDDYGLDPARIHVVGFGRNVLPDRDLAAPPASRNWRRPSYLFVGMQWERKNGDAVVRAFERIRSDQPDARLDVVGDHPRLDVPGVRAHGVIDVGTPGGRRRLAELYAAATCFVLPSRYEAFGIAYAEAGGFGVPSIATDVGGTRDAAGPAAEYVDPESDEHLLAAMRRLADGGIARRAGAAAAEHAALLTWSQVAGRVLGALGLIDPRTAPADLPAV